MEIGEKIGKTTYSYSIKPHKPVRPMVIIRDRNDYRWICDKGVDPRDDLEKQGCWRCGGLVMTFTRDD
jgi:hypothetical protein